MRKIRMYTKAGKWIVKDGDRLVEFASSYDAWAFVFLLRKIKPEVPYRVKSMYPVNTLDPRPAMMRKKIVF